MRLRNLRSRLTFGVLAVLLVVLAVGGVVVAGDQNQAERQTIDDRLRRTAELSDTTALAAVEQSLPEADPRLDQVLRATGSSLRVSIGETTLLQAGVRLPDTVRGPLGFSTRTIDGRRVRIYVKTLRDDSLGGLARLQATTSLRQLEARQRRLQERLIVLGLGILLLTGAGTWFAADLVLRPLRRLRRATTDIEGDADLERRVPESGPAEVRGLARSFNAMLERLGRSAQERRRALDATRRFAADAGHELRTPLTAVQATLSTIHRHPEMDAETRQAIAGDALEEQRRLVSLLDGLQALARGDANPVHVEDLDLVGLVADAAQMLRSRHPDLDVQTVVPEGRVVVRGWEPGLRVVLDNLVLNAARHGRRGGTVRVTVAASASGDAARPTLVVEDDGPGIPAEERAADLRAVRPGGRNRPPGLRAGTRARRSAGRASRREHHGGRRAPGRGPLHRDVLRSYATASSRSSSSAGAGSCGAGALRRRAAASSAPTMAIPAAPMKAAEKPSVRRCGLPS